MTVPWPPLGSVHPRKEDRTLHSPRLSSTSGKADSERLAFPFCPQWPQPWVSFTFPSSGRVGHWQRTYFPPFNESQNEKMRDLLTRRKSGEWTCDKVCSVVRCSSWAGTRGGFLIKNFELLQISQFLKYQLDPKLLFFLPLHLQTWRESNVEDFSVSVLEYNVI